MKTTIAIINYDTPQFIYYLVQSIKKQCNEDYSLCIFDNGRERRIVNKLDNITIYRNNKNRYFKVDNLSIDEVYDKSIRTLCNILTDDRLIIINPCTLVNNTFLNVYKNSDLFFETFDNKCVSISLNSIDKSLLDDYNKPIIDVLKDHYEFKTVSNCTVALLNDMPFEDWIYSNKILWKKDFIDVIFSLTTFKGRIYDYSTYRVIFSLVNQQTKYNYKVVLVLSREEFGYSFELPGKLKYLADNTDKFEILWTDKNTKPLKKLDPTMEKYPDIPIITLDDDDLCDENILDYIMQEHINEPYYVLGTWVEQTPNFIKWVAGVRLFPPHCLYNFPLEDYYTYYDGILDDNWNAMRCAFKMTPVKGISTEHNSKINQTDLKLTRDYQKTPWGEYYKRFIIAHLDEIPEELYYE